MIRLIYKELVYDIEQQTFRIAHPRTEDNPELRDMAQLNHNSLSDDDYIRRFVESGVALLHIWLRRKLLAPNSNEGFWTGWGSYNANQPDPNGTTTTTTETTEETIYDDAINRNVANYDFKLGANADEKALAMLFHRFIVRYALWQWTHTFGYSDLSMAYKSQADDMKQEIQGNLFDIALPKKYHESRYNTCSCRHHDNENPEVEVITDTDDDDTNYIQRPDDTPPGTDW